MPQMIVPHQPTPPLQSAQSTATTFCQAGPITALVSISSLPASKFYPQTSFPTLRSMFCLAHLWLHLMLQVWRSISSRTSPAWTALSIRPTGSSAWRLPARLKILEEAPIALLTTAVMWLLRRRLRTARPIAPIETMAAIAHEQNVAKFEFTRGHRTISLICMETEHALQSECEIDEE